MHVGELRRREEMRCKRDGPAEKCYMQEHVHAQPDIHLIVLWCLSARGGRRSIHLGVVQQAGDLLDPIQLSHFRGGRGADADVIEQEPLGRPRPVQAS